MSVVLLSQENVILSVVGKRWTEEEESRLLQLLDSGSSAQEIADDLGRTLAAVRARRTKLTDMRGTKHCKTWEPKEVNYLLTYAGTVPRKRLAEVLKGKKAIGVLDRSVGFGWNCGPMCMELKALTPEIGIVPMLSYIDGLANLDITIPHIERVIDEVHAAAQGKPYQEVTWIPLEE